MSLKLKIDTYEVPMPPPMNGVMLHQVPRSR